MASKEASIGPGWGEGVMLDLQEARRHYRARKAQQRAQLEAERQRWLQRAREIIPSLARRHPGVRGVYLYGSLLQSGRFRSHSDIDVALECDTLEAESAFWRALERELERDVDARPLSGAVAEAVRREGEQVYG